jgi:hypothetical protein
MNIIIGENLKELNFIINNLNNLDKDFYVVPVDLDTLIFCDQKKINYFNPIDFIGNNFHKEALISSNILLKNLNYGSIKLESLKKEYKNYIRKKYNQFFFSHFILSEIIKKKKIKKIFVSGWENYSNDLKNYNNYYLTAVVKEFFASKVEIISISNKKKENIINRCCTFNLSLIDKSKKKKILITSSGYNIYRVILISLFLRYSVYVISENKINSSIKNFLNILGLNILTFKKEKYNNIVDFKIEKINFVYQNKDFSSLLNLAKKYFDLKLSEIYYKSECVEKFLDNTEIDLIVSVMARGYQGCIVEYAKNSNIKTLGITHGTISKNFSDLDRIYKKAIAEGVFSKNYDFFPLQTKICYDSVKTHSLPQSNLKSGNLIFAENFINFRRKNKILYAVTSKNFNQMQFHGVESYFEFYKNLEIFNTSEISNLYEILVNLHPAVSEYSLVNLRKKFKNLSFTKKKISSCLKKAFVTISYSSTVIEDSICSKVPVILFDNWRRYKHCESESKFFENSEPIFYVNSLDKLKTCIEKIKRKKINFEKILYGGNCFNNIYRLLKKII